MHKIQFQGKVFIEDQKRKESSVYTFFTYEDAHYFHAAEKVGPTYKDKGFFEGNTPNILSKKTLIFPKDAFEWLYELYDDTLEFLIRGLLKRIQSIKGNKTLLCYSNSGAQGEFFIDSNGNIGSYFEDEAKAIVTLLEVMRSGGSISVRQYSQKIRICGLRVSNESVTNITPEELELESEIDDSNVEFITIEEMWND